MPVPKELLTKIEQSKQEGYTPDEIIGGLSQSKNFPEIAAKTKIFQAQGYSSLEILQGLEKSAVVSESRTVAEGVVYPFKRTAEIYNQEVQESVATMKGAYEEPTGRNIGSAALALLRYGMAPMTAPIQGIMKEPVQEALKGVGVPKGAAEFVGNTLETAAYFVPYGKLIKTAIGMQEIPKTIGMAERAAKTAGITTKAEEIPVFMRGGKPPLKYPVEPTPEFLKTVEAEGQLVKPIIQETLQKQIADAAISAVGADIKADKRIGQQIVDLVYSGEFNWKELPNVLEKYKITAEEFSFMLKDTYSTAGRTLGKLSYVVKQLKRTFRDDPRVVKALDELGQYLPDASRVDMWLGRIGKAENVRRAALVTQLATTMRNIGSQTARTTLGAVDESFQGAIRGTVGGEGHTLRQMGEGLDTFNSLLSRFGTKGRKRLSSILESENAELANMRLFAAPVHEVWLGGKVANALNTLNRTQEFFFRKLAFEAKLRSTLKQRGMDYRTIDLKTIPKDTLEKSVDYALEMTFAAMPKSKFAAKYIRAWSENPFMTALVNPFPRFNFANALPFLYKFSPISFLEAASPKTLAQLATGNPAKFAEAASKATLGTMMLGLASWYRNKPDAGEKWYEIQAGIDEKTGKTQYLDTRAYAPFSTYLFIAESIFHPEKVDAADFSQALLGLNRIAGTGLVIADILRSKKVETAAETMSNIAGAWLSGFSVPFRTPKDIYSAFDPDETIARDRREERILGSIKTNIPGVSQTLPELPSPLQSESLRTEHPVLRQLTGLTLRTKTEIQKEVDRLNMDFSRIAPSTGTPEADRLMSRYMGPAIEKIAPSILGSPKYKVAPEPIKRILLAELFSEARAMASGMIAKSRPDLMALIKYDAVKQDIKNILKEKGFDKKKLKDMQPPAQDIE